MCDKKCNIDGGCPFAQSEESETIQNYGCLPTSFEILAMRIYKGKTWACHSDVNKPCKGGLDALKRYGYDNTIVRPLVKEEDLTIGIFCFEGDSVERLTARIAKVQREEITKKFG